MAGCGGSCGCGGACGSTAGVLGAAGGCGCSDNDAAKVKQHRASGGRFDAAGESPPAPQGRFVGASSPAAGKSPIPRAESLQSENLLARGRRTSPECGEGVQRAPFKAAAKQTMFGKSARFDDTSRDHGKWHEWVPKPGESVRLFPDPIGPLPDDNRAAYVLYERLRQRKRDAAALERPKEHDPLEGLRANYRRAKRRGPQPPAPDAAAKLAAPAVVFRFGYGEVSFDVDTPWLIIWSWGVGKSTADEVLDAIWDDFRAVVDSAGGDAADVHQSIGCYNLSKDPSEWLFWNEGWGAPHRFHMNALQMLVVYNHLIRDHESQHPCGAGSAFGNFVRDIITDQTAVRSEYLTDDDTLKGQAVPNFRVHFLTGVGNEPEIELQGEAGEFACSDSANGAPFAHVEACGLAATDWYPQITPGRVGEFIIGRANGRPAGNDTWYDNTADPENFEARNGAPKSNCGFGASTGEDRDCVRMQAHMLQFYGHVSDHVLWQAHVAYDYYLHTGEAAYLDAARALGRHVLNQILSHAGHMAHEMGHIFCGGNHCTNNNCFMNHARYRFECAVRGRLGLYHDTLDFSADNDACFVLDDVGCSSNSVGRADPKFWQCATADTDGEIVWDAALGAFVEATCESSQKLSCRLGDWSPLPGGIPTFVLGEATGSQFCMSTCGFQVQTGWEGHCPDVGVVARTHVTLDNGEEMTWRTCDL